MAKTLYLMRHGQTLFNQLGKIQGACDSPLTDEGIRQATIAKQYFDDNNITFDSLYCSTQERASDTLEIVSGQTDYTRLKGIKEWGFGLYEGETERLNPKRKEGETSFGDSFVPFGGESSRKVQDRMVRTLTDVMNKEGNDSILAVSHAGAMYLFIQAWLDYKEIETLSFSNCCILKFSFENDTFTFVEEITHSF